MVILTNTVKSPRVAQRLGVLMVRCRPSDGNNTWVTRHTVLQISVTQHTHKYERRRAAKLDDKICVFFQSLPPNVNSLFDSFAIHVRLYGIILKAVG